MRNFEEFVNEVKDMVKDHLPEMYRDAEVVVIEHRKINSCYTGLTIYPKDSVASPVINLTQMYQDHAHDMTEVMKHIENTLLTLPDNVKKMDVSDILDYESIKEKLFLRVSSIKKNAAFLKNVPYIAVEDLALTFHILVGQDEQDMASATVTHQMLKDYGVCIETLYKDTVQSSMTLFPARFIDTILMTVVTNDKGINGAASLFYPGIMDKIGSEIVYGNYYILPSSIHEVLVVPDTIIESPDELKQIIKAVNKEAVAPEEQLSDELYYYDTKNKIFKKMKE